MEMFISLECERYNQLIRAEQDANMLKAFIANHHETNTSVYSSELELLYNLFIGKKEDNNV